MSLFYLLDNQKTKKFNYNMYLHLITTGKKLRGTGDDFSRNEKDTGK